MPHSEDCECHHCQAMVFMDELRFAKSRLNAYKVIKKKLFRQDFNTNLHSNLIFFYIVSRDWPVSLILACQVKTPSLHHSR